MNVVNVGGHSSSMLQDHEAVRTLSFNLQLIGILRVSQVAEDIKDPFCDRGEIQQLQTIKT